MADELPDIQYTARDFTTIKKALSDYVTSTRPEVWSDFFESNIGVALMELIAYVGDVYSFGINRAGEESFPVTAKRYKSILKHAKWLSYKPRAQVSASVGVAAVAPLPPQLASDPMIIEAHTSISVGGIPFETLKELTFPAGSTSITFTLTQGETQEEEYISDGSTFQQFVSPEGEVIEGSWEVYVDNVLWTEVEFITLTTNTPSYSAEFTDDDSKLVINFGDGVTGKIPPASSVVKLIYRTGVGATGNIAAGAIEHNIAAKIALNTVSLKVINNNSASGGADEESLEHIQRWAPLHVKTVDKCITREDYNTHASTFSDPTYGAVARAQTKLRSGTLGIYQGSEPGTPITVPLDTVVTVNGIPDNFKTLTEITFDGNNMSFFIDPNTVDIYVWAHNGVTYVPPSTGLKEALLTYLMERSVVTTTPYIKDGQTFPIDIDFGTIHCNRQYELADVEANVNTTIDAFFNDVAVDPGGPFILSDFYNVIENTVGVDHFVIQTPTDDVAVTDVQMIVKGVITATYEYAIEDLPDIYGKY